MRKLGEQGIEIEVHELSEICEELAYSMLVEGYESLSPKEIASRLSPLALSLIQPIDIGGRSLLNKKSDGSFRFAHRTVMEYLAFRRCLNPQVSLEKALPRSDVVKQFLRLWLKRTDLVAATSISILRKNLEGVSLENLDLSGISLEEGDLSDSVLLKVELRGARLNDASLRQANLSYAHLQGAILAGADLKKAKLKGASLRQANLKGSVLIDSDLSESKLTEASLIGVTLDGADLFGAELLAADLRGVDLTRVVGLSQIQVNVAIGDGKTKLPDDLKVPEEWV